MRRLLAAAFVFCASAGSAAAQVHIVPTVGLDAGYEAPLAGIAVETGVGRLPVTVRPGVEVVLPSAFAEDISDTPVVRVAVDVLARLNAANVPNTPYGIVGVAAERERRETFSGAERAVLDTLTDRVGFGVRAGAGLRLGRFVAEATLGAGGAGRGRVVVGLRF
ncbi:MAG TPA: hypothetical protein VF594_04270 [Rubricoccaceae bacterium]|jgi:hypothetical protein